MSIVVDLLVCLARRLDLRAEGLSSRLTPSDRNSARHRTRLDIDYD